MNAIRIATVLAVIGAGATAEPLLKVEAAAKATFSGMPRVFVVEPIAGRCGADDTVNKRVAFCTTDNTIYMNTNGALGPDAAYLAAHAMGHAAQVRHGVADIALATIRANPADEANLRLYVSQQVDCLAGVFFARAGLPRASLLDWYIADPFADPHWGRNPLSAGPVVQIGLATREDWFQKGQSGNVADCAVPVFGADLLIAADQRK